MSREAPAEQPAREHRERDRATPGHSVATDHGGRRPTPAMGRPAMGAEQPPTTLRQLLRRVYARGHALGPRAASSGTVRAAGGNACVDREPLRDSAARPPAVAVSVEESTRTPHVPSAGRADRSAELLAATELHNEVITFCAGVLDTPALFMAKRDVGRIVVHLNSSHPAFELVCGAVLDAGNAGEITSGTIRPVTDVDGVNHDLAACRAGLRLLIEGWVRYEHDLTGARAQRAADARIDWGRVMRQVVAP